MQLCKITFYPIDNKSEVVKYIFTKNENIQEAYNLAVDRVIKNTKRLFYYNCKIEILGSEYDIIIEQQLKEEN